MGVEHTLFRIQHHPLTAMNDFPSSSEPAPPATDNIIEAVQELKAAAEAKAREFGQAAGEKIHDIRDAAGRVIDDSKDRWQELGDHAVAYVKENPGKAVLAGLGAGFLIGLLFREK